MIDLLVILSAKVSYDELRVFVAQNGGVWRNLPDKRFCARGVIQEGHAAVYLTYDAGDSLEALIGHDIDQITGKVGSEILTVVSMQVGHAKGSVELAREIAARMIAQWGGMPLPDGWSWADYGIDCNLGP